jgi:hypothetical protein
VDQRQASRKPTTSHALPQRVPYRGSRHDLPRGPRQQNGSMSCHPMRHPCPPRRARKHTLQRAKVINSLCERRRPLARVGFCSAACLASPLTYRKTSKDGGWGAGSEQRRREHPKKMGVVDGSGERSAPGIPAAAAERFRPHADRSTVKAVGKKPRRGAGARTMMRRLARTSASSFFLPSSTMNFSSPIHRARLSRMDDGSLVRATDRQKGR